MVNKRWRIRVSIPVPRACKARTLPIELIPLISVVLVPGANRPQVGAKKSKWCVVRESNPGHLLGRQVF